MTARARGATIAWRERGRRAVLTVLAAMLVVACSGVSGPGPATTFKINGYDVTCKWTGQAINAGGPPTIGPEAETFCRSRAREAVGTLLAKQPGAKVQSVSIEKDGSAEVCYGDPAKPTCAPMLPAVQNP